MLPFVRAFTVSGKMRPEEAVVATLSSLPDEVVDTVGTGLPSEDAVSERRRKLDYLQMQEEKIKVLYNVFFFHLSLSLANCLVSVVGKKV